jgi:hypothetical protein
MNYGFDNGKFYVEYSACTRPVGSLRSESDKRAREIYSNNQKIILCTSSGLDSQTALYSFLNQGIPVECAFMYLPGYNDLELENIKLLEKKYGHKTEIISIDPNKVKDEVVELSNKFDTNPFHGLHYKFVEQLPKDYDVVQVIHDPWIITANNKHYVYHSFYDPEISRYETLKNINRQGNIVLFGDSSELFLSSITDSIFDYFLTSHQYFNGNGLKRQGIELHDIYRYDFYIKPLLYSKHWGDNLLYFPKFAGYENIPWLKEMLSIPRKERICAIEREELIGFLRSQNNSTMRYYQIK